MVTQPNNDTAPQDPPAERQRLDVLDAEPGIYGIRSSSSTVYFLDTTSQPPRVLRAQAGDSQRFVGDGEWHRLRSLQSGPNLVKPADPSDVVDWVVRVGSRHRYEWETRLSYEWRVGRVVERIDGPLTDAEIAAKDAAVRDLPPDPPQGDGSVDLDF